MIRAKTTIQKVKRKVNRKIPLSVVKLAAEMNLSETTVRRVFKKDLKLKPYKMTVQPSLTDRHKKSRKRFANCIRTNFRKEDTMKILFFDEKMFDIDGVYNSQNERIWAANHMEADVKGGIKRRRKYSQKIMVWLAVCSQGVSPLIIFEDGTLDHVHYTNEVLPVALQYGNKVFGNHWTFQQDGGRPHIHTKTQQWCAENFPAFIDKDRWPNSPDLNQLDYSIWDEVASRINWKKITSKKTLIYGLKLPVHRIHSEVVFESCSSWTIRLSRLSTNNGEYIR